MNDIYILVENVTDADGSVDLPAFNLGYFNNIVNAQRMAELFSTPAQKFFVKTVNHASGRNFQSNSRLSLKLP